MRVCPIGRNPRPLRVAGKTPRPSSGRGARWCPKALAVKRQTDISARICWRKTSMGMGLPSRMNAQ